ncbi:MAG: ATP-binding protein [Desulfocapsaceae bacterium]|nr:ATP-binding protein [Desulfocapsaceae bacterium]
MSFSIKIGLSFTLLLIFTTLVASISWYGTAESIRNQNAIYIFSSDLKQKFSRLAIAELNYSTERQPEYSKQVFATIASIRKQLSKEPLTAGTGERHRLLEQITSELNGYEENFLRYTRSAIDYEALESRLYNELDKLSSATTDFLKTSPAQGDEVNDYILEIMLNNLRHFSASFVDVTRDNHFQLIAELTSLITPYLEQNAERAIQLQAFRLNRSLGVYKLALQKYYDIQVQLNSQKSLLHQQIQALQVLIEKYITLERDTLEEKNFRYLLAALAVTLFSGLLALCVAFYLSRRIVVPIASLKQSAQQVVKGNLDTTVDVQSTDEIGDLSRIFNEMTGKLRSSFAHLERYKKHLEGLVDKRTNELTKKVREKELAEESLRTSQKNIQRVIDQIPVGIIVLDEYLLIQQWNPAAQRIFGYSNFEAHGEHTSFIVADEAKQQVEDVFTRMKETKREVRNKNYNRTRSGEIILGNWYNAPFLDHKNEITGFISIVEDITEKDRKEKEHLKFAKLEAAGVLAGGIAHDFNNILTAILGNISLALTDKELSENTRKLLLNSEKASIRAKSLTQQLLTFAKGGEPVKETTSLRDIIIESASFVLHGGNVSIDYDFDEDVWPVEADKGQLSQVIQNIILNARHAMPEGGTIYLGCYNLSKDQKLPELAELAGHPLVHLKIRDQGIGMPRNILERIFDPYFSTKQDGSGLGLAVTYSIIQKHGGHISVESDQGIGTTFHVYLPASSAELSKDAEIISPATTAEQAWKILVMDDEEMVRDLLEMMLADQGHTVICCREGSECLSLFEQELQKGSPVDLVIMDLTVPGGMGGKESAQKILDLKPDARIVVASGYSNDPIMSDYHAYGFMAALSKPFTIEDVRATIAKLQKDTVNKEN